MKKKLAFNTTSSIIYQITVVICGLIIPRLILGAYGSNANGLIQSITQFLTVISFLELGVGSVIQSALYKPLSEKNMEHTSLIVSSGERFFKRIAAILIVYIILLIGFYPLLVKNSFGWFYTIAMILALGLNSFSQYYFGILDKLILNSDQRGYVQYTSQTIAVIINAVFTAILIYLKCPLQVVKLSTSIIYLLRAIVIRNYVNRYYCIDRHKKYDVEPIKQKWNGIAQHIAAIILDNTDTIVLTFFSTLANVSIYSVYHMVIYGIKQLFQAASAGIQAALGNLWARQELEKLNIFFEVVEFSLHFATVYLFSCTAILLQPFISVYTKGITDVDYHQPLFGVLIVLAHGMHCIRFPYNLMILAAGHYKQTQKYYIIAALINASVSIVAVIFWGLEGVAVGTLAAMTYHSIWMIVYNSKNILYWPVKSAIKQFLLDILLVILIWISTFWINMRSTNYLSWFFMAVEVAGIAFLVTMLISMIFCKDKIRIIFNFLKNRGIKK